MSSTQVPSFGIIASTVLAPESGSCSTSSVNVVQSSFPDQDQGEISGLSRSVSNLGSSLGTVLVGSVLVVVKFPEGRPFAVALRPDDVQLRPWGEKG